ncbi:MAG: DNA (cytosine-5-)-methyltransferase [bacterium]
MEKTVIELFAGVGGFRVGLNEVYLSQDGKTVEKDNFKFIWANQWEPSTKTQHAYECYKYRFNDNTISNEDITTVNKKGIPDHTLLVGGFPCQDYSVARSLSKEQGIQGKKGVLWWQINDILEIKRPPFVLLENVDRLIKSPSTQRGRDFGIMLRCFDDLGYAVEWRILNAADYGHAQRRRRIYIFAYHKSTKFYHRIFEVKPKDILFQDGLFAKTFPIINDDIFMKEINISKSNFTDLVVVSNKFKFPFENSGFMIDGIIHTAKTHPAYIKPRPLKDIIENRQVEMSYYLNDSKEKFEYLKGSKRVPREKNGIKYTYSEGKMTFPEDLSLPGRTMLTSEGTVNRSTHVIEDSTGRLRILTPIETERLNEFPDNWTNTGMPTKRRYFMMGNALVTGLVKKLGHHIDNIISNE